MYNTQIEVSSVYSSDYNQLMEQTIISDYSSNYNNSILNKKRDIIS